MFSDPYARHFLRGFWKLVIHTPLRAVVFERGMRRLRPVGGQVQARSRYAEDKLQQALDRGVEQYVIVGAGYDTFALRRPELSERVRIFEVDHPATQAAKIERLRQLTRERPVTNVVFVPVDLERQRLADRLRGSDFDPARPAFFSWLGTTAYLTPEATLEALADMVEVAAPGSEVVFDYLGVESCLRDAEHVAMYRFLRDFTRKRGEPIIGELEPEQLPGQLQQVGLTVVEQLDYDQQFARYFLGRADDQTPMPGSYLVHAAVQQASVRSAPRSPHLETALDSQRAAGAPRSGPDAARR